MDGFPRKELELPVRYRAAVWFRWSWRTWRICRRANLTAGSRRRRTACAGCRCCPVCCWLVRMSAACTFGGVSCPGETLTSAPDAHLDILVFYPKSRFHVELRGRNPLSCSGPGGVLPAPTVILIRPVSQQCRASCCHGARRAVSGISWSCKRV